MVVAPVVADGVVGEVEGSLEDVAHGARELDVVQLEHDGAHVLREGVPVQRRSEVDGVLDWAGCLYDVHSEGGCIQIKLDQIVVKGGK